MRYHVEKMRKQIEFAQRDGYTFTIQTEEKIQYETEYYGTITLAVLGEETKKIAKRFPAFDVCVMVYEDDEEKEHWLYIRFKQEIRLRYGWVKNNGELILHCDADLANTVFKNNLEFDRIRQFFKQLVEELPEYRLRILTGELKVEDWTI